LFFKCFNQEILEDANPRRGARIDFKVPVLRTAVWMVGLGATLYLAYELLT